MTASVRLSLSLVALLPFSLFAQINLHQFRSASVRVNKNVPTSVESVLVVTQVANGLAKTNVTMVLTPGAYRSYQWVRGPEVCDQNGCHNTSEIVWDTKPAEHIDSIEISSHFRLPTDWVAKEMWLWVEGEKVRAEIQDRALARGQYEQIVNRRRDPCLFEFNGNGSYSVRIFPAESYKARKVELQFQHTLDDDSAGLITATLPQSHAQRERRQCVRLRHAGTWLREVLFHPARAGEERYLEPRSRHYLGIRPLGQPRLPVGRQRQGRADGGGVLGHAFRIDSESGAGTRDTGDCA
jgi:hypothetical protein